MSCWKRSIVRCGLPALAVMMTGAIAAAEPETEFSELEHEMAAAQESYISSLRAPGGQPNHAGGGTDRPDSDRRLEILEKMDQMALASGGVKGGGYIAVQSFVWSWMLDLDLGNLLNRFALVVAKHPDDAGMAEPLEMIPTAYVVSATPVQWVAQLEQLSGTTTVPENKLGALSTMGRVLLESGSFGDAKSAFNKVIKLAPNSDRAGEARTFIFDIENLQVGMIAPSFAARTLDGREVSLKSLRGKTVLLDFWATWCASCIQEMPHLKSVAARLREKPFVILSVSLDDSKPFLVDMVKAHQLPGIHTWDESGRENPIAELYNARMLPTWYLIDENGVIRARNPFGDKLLPAIEAVVGHTAGKDTVPLGR